MAKIIKMKFTKLFLSLLAIISLTVFACHTQGNTKVISIGYHSDDCEDCNTLKSKMKKMNRMFLTSSIVFIKYDKTTTKSKSKAEEKLLKWEMLEIAQTEEGLKKVILYDASTKEKIVQLDYSDSIEVLENKIREVLNR